VGNEEATQKQQTSGRPFDFNTSNSGHLGSALSLVGSRLLRLMQPKGGIAASANNHGRENHMLKRMLKCRILVAMMIAAAGLTTLAVRNWSAPIIAPAFAVTPASIYPQLQAEERHFDVYRNSRAAFDATGGEADCYWRSVINDD
jgi:hypothetical protein